MSTSFDDILQSSINLSTPVSKTEFKPWHRPRKQWLREHQWFKLIRQTFRMPASDEVFRYLTLPGPEFLDIRHFADRFAQTECLKDRKILFIGFIGPDEKQPEMVLGESGVLDVTNVHGESKLVPRRIEDLSNQDIKHQLLQSYKPFDVINLDLTNSFLSGKQRGNGYASVLMDLLQHQNRYRTDPYLVFITSQTSRDTVNMSQFKEYFVPVLTKNAAESDDFRNLLFSVFGEACIENESTLSSEKFSNFFGVGLYKWLMSVVATGAWIVTLKSIYQYTIKNRGDMISMALKVEKRGLVDQSGLVNATKQSGKESSATARLTETGLAIEALQQLEKSNDLDTLIERSGKMDELIESSATLLCRVGYDTEDYKQWARKMSVYPEKGRRS